MDLEEKNALMEERRLHDLELQRIFGTTSIRCSEEEYEKVKDDEKNEFISQLCWW